MSFIVIRVTPIPKELYFISNMGLLETAIDEIKDKVGVSFKYSIEKPNGEVIRKGAVKI